MRKTKMHLAVLAAALLFAPAALASHGGGGVKLPGGGGDLGGGGGGNGGGGAVTTSGPLTGTWSGLETFPGVVLASPRNSVLSITQNGNQLTGTYTEIVAGDSPVFKVTGTVTGSTVVMTLSQGGKASLHPDLGMSGTVSADGNTIDASLAGFPVKLTR